MIDDLPERLLPDRIGARVVIADLPARSAESDKRSILIANESTNLLAGALDRASTAMFTVGFVTPFVNDLYGSGKAVSPGILAARVYIWLCAAVSFHISAQRVLRGMR